MEYLQSAYNHLQYSNPKKREKEQFTSIYRMFLYSRMMLLLSFCGELTDVLQETMIVAHHWENVLQTYLNQYLDNM